jgi:hypothetical protein
MNIAMLNDSRSENATASKTPTVTFKAADFMSQNMIGRVISQGKMQQDRCYFEPFHLRVESGADHVRQVQLKQDAECRMLVAKLTESSKSDRIFKAASLQTKRQSQSGSQSPPTLSQAVFHWEDTVMGPPRKRRLSPQWRRTSSGTQPSIAWVEYGL